MKRKLWVCLVVCLVFVIPAAARAQTSSSALVAGTVYDKTGGVVPGATIELKDVSTNTVYTQTSNPAGQYLFSTVAPGTYKMTVTAQGFRTWVQPKLQVAVAKSYSVNATLEIGELTQTVEVAATVGAELQKTDATVGTAIGGEELLRLPTSNRSAASVLLLQPLVQPVERGTSVNRGGQVAGARSDQTTFLIDGGEATSDTEGTGAYNTGFAGEIRPMIPVPQESIEEFRVGTTNPNSTFGRSQGGQVTLMTKRGTNNLHGSVYWYHQNSALNANSWDLNTSGIKKPNLIDNRYGGTLGGPILKDRLFLFGHYEGRRFPLTTTFTRAVPSPDFRRGIVKFADRTGLRTYNLNLANGPIAPNCNSVNTPVSCDPRNLGMSPVIAAELAKLPGATPGVTGIGDGVNILGYRNFVSTGIRTEFGVARMDYKINNNWNLFASGRYHYFQQPGPEQIDYVGLTGCSAPCATRVNPLQPRFYAIGVTGQLNPHLMSETHFSWYRHWWEWGTAAPFPQVAGTAAALSLAGEGTGSGVLGNTKIGDPMNIDTQNARSRVWNGKDTYIAENLTYLKGTHTFQFGGDYRFENIFHQRTDKVTGGLSTGPIFYLNGGGFVSMTDSNGVTYRPPNCTAVVTTNCLNSSGDVGRWDDFYTTLLGIPDRSAQLLSRDGNLNPQPIGTPLLAQVHIHAVEGYFQDIWRVRPSLSLTLGLTYQVQKPPTEELGRQIVPIYANNGAPVDMVSYFQNREAAAVSGNVLNPDIAFMPINHLAGQKYVTNIYWHGFGPRLAFAWQPGSRLRGLGDGKSVLRGGWSVAYTRMNGVGLVMTPILGAGSGTILSCNGPRFTGTACGLGSDPTNALRIGPTSGGWNGDGSSILPSRLPVSPAQIPFPVAAPYGETRNFLIDPGLKLGYSHSFDLTLQRELPWHLLVEVGYVGRLGRNLIQNVDFNAVPFMMVDKKSGQTLGAAFDAIAQFVRSNPAPGTLPQKQDWFENIAGAAACNAGLIRSTACPTGPPNAFPSVTAYLANKFPRQIAQGNLSAIMLTNPGGIDLLMLKAGQQPIDNIQVQVNNLTSDRGLSNYHAGFVALHRRFANGLQFDTNYTYSHSLDFYGLNQEQTQFSFTSPFRPDFDYQPSQFDRRHVFNMHWYYELPFGAGKRFSTGSSALKRVIGGWYSSGIWSISSGVPLCVNGSFNYGTPNPASSCLLPNAGFSNPGASVHDTGGGKLNLFADPTAVMNSFHYPLITQDTRFGDGVLRGLRHWNLDLSFGKKTSITERAAVAFQVDFLNAFNHVIFNDPATDATRPASFGVLNSQQNLPRYIQLGLRVEF